MKFAMIPHDPKPHLTRADAWRTVGEILTRRHPDFPLAVEVAKRIADHHEARLPLGYESVPVQT